LQYNSINTFLYYSVFPNLSIAVWQYHNVYVKRRDCLVAWDRIVSSTSTETVNGSSGYFSYRHSTPKEMPVTF